MFSKKNKKNLFFVLLLDVLTVYNVLNKINLIIKIQFSTIKFLIMSGLKIDFGLSVLRKAFDSFDREKSGSIPTDMVADILRLMGQPFNKKILDELIDEVDADS